MPNIAPDWNAPFMQGIQTIASYVLAGSMMIALIALVIAIVAIAFKGFGNAGFQSWGGSNLLKLILVVVLLGSVNGIFAFFVGFDLGF